MSNLKNVTLFSYLLIQLAVASVLFSCAHTPKHEQKQKIIANSSSPAVPKKQSIQEITKSYTQKEVSIHPGDIKLITLPYDKLLGTPSIFCNGKKIPLVIKDNYIFSYLVESYFSSQKKYECFLTFNSFISTTPPKTNKYKIYTIHIKTKKYKQERLLVDKKKLVLSPKDLKRYFREKEILNKIYKNSQQEHILFSSSFRSPLNSKITSEYGVKRIYNNSKKSQHLGIDFRAKIGTPIKVTNSGIVVLTADLFFTGNTIIVDHGINIFSIYAHLSEIKVKAGEKVDKGAIIGYSGVTGRITGPHLHWGVKAQNKWINGLTLVEQSKDFNEIYKNRSAYE